MEDVAKNVLNNLQVGTKRAFPFLHACFALTTNYTVASYLQINKFHSIVQHLHSCRDYVAEANFHLQYNVF